MEEKLKKILIDLLEIDSKNITDELSYENTETWDSLKHMEIIASIEDQFEVTLTADEIVKMTSYAQIKQVLKNKDVENGT